MAGQWDAQVENILAGMTLEEKIALGEGASFWSTRAFPRHGIPALFLCDGPHGLRRQDKESGTDMLGVNRSRPATCFPAAVTTAMSWDPQLLEEIGAAIGAEARDQGVNVVLGPGANLKRSPLCGRNFEYFSEDPYLAGKLAAGQIRGLEQAGVGASLKHFAANSQEYRRFHSESVLDERTLRELYLTAFEIAVKEGRPSTVMCAYPRLNGAYCSDNHWLLTQVLRREWGFDGAVVTDWGGMNDRVEGFRAGCDLNMPGGSRYMARESARAVRAGDLPPSAVDESARRMIRLSLALSRPARAAEPCDYDAHHALARRAAEEGAALLKNEGGLLPLKEGVSLAVIGHMAEHLRYQGSGSSHINPTRLSRPLDCLPGARYAPGCDGRGDTTQALLDQAARTAAEAEVAVVFAGLPARFESEGFDRADMTLPQGQDRMIRAVARANPNTVVVLLCGGPVECPWADQVRAILYLGLPGQAGGEAAADLLFGRANPGGKLAESWPCRYEDVPSWESYGKTRDALYLEGIYVGYRYYDKAGAAVRWPFGFGLSYTSFAYANLRVEADAVTAEVINTGDRPGAEVAQLYLAPPPGGAHRPVKELKSFARVYLQPGERRTVRFPLTRRSFAIWQDGWKVPGGVYTVLVGGNSRDLPLRGELPVDGEVVPAPDWQPGSWYEHCSGSPGRREWEAMLGRAHVPREARKGDFTLDNSLMEMREESRLMGVICGVISRFILWKCGGRKAADSPEARMLLASSVEAPLRCVQISSGISGGLFQGLVDMANGHFFRGVGRMLRG